MSWQVRAHLLIPSGGRWLVVDRGEGPPSLPGGEAEWGEHPLDALRRCTEGLGLEPTRLLGARTAPSDTPGRSAVIEVVYGSPVPAAAPPGTRWIAPDQGDAPPALGALVTDLPSWRGVPVRTPRTHSRPLLPGADRRVRVGVYVLCQGPKGVLLTRLSDLDPGGGRWTLPGGGIEEGEDPLPALHREVAEETSLTLTDVGLIEIDHYVFPSWRDRTPVHQIGVVHHGTADGEPAVAEVGGSTAEARWVPREDLPALPMLGLAARALTHAGLLPEGRPSPPPGPPPAGSTPS